MWYRRNNARCEDGKTVVTCSIVHAPEMSFGSVLCTTGGVINGVNAETSRPCTVELSCVNEGSTFFPKILESNVAIVDYSFHCCPLCIRYQDSHFLSSNSISGYANSIIRTRPADIVLFDQNVLKRPAKPRPFSLSNAIYQFQA